MQELPQVLGRFIMFIFYAWSPVAIFPHPLVMWRSYGKSATYINLYPLTDDLHTKNDDVPYFFHIIN